LGHAREAAITNLLQLGLIETDYQAISPDLLNTGFGDQWNRKPG
jgi:hypothetical protein